MNIKRLYQINSLGTREISHGGIRVEKLEHRVQPRIPFPHKHDFYQLILITNGKGWHEIDFSRYNVSKGIFFFMKPAQVHSWSLSKDIKGIMIEFSREALGLDISAFIEIMPDCLSLKTEKEFQTMLNLAELMLNEFNAKNTQYEIANKNILEALLIFLGRNVDLKMSVVESKSKPKLHQVEELKKLIEQHFKTEHSVNFYAKEMGTNAKNLTMAITRAIGKSPSHLIQERILLEAKRYLAYSELSVSEIGFELGFEDPNYFSRFFRTHTKESPLTFRKDKV